jgi:hypothetical protein
MLNRIKLLGAEAADELYRKKIIWFGPNGNA